MEWTTEQPTKLGLYWAINPRMKPTGAVMVQVSDCDDGLAAMEMGYEFWGDLDEYTHWMGPIEEPGPPDNFYANLIG